MCCRRNCCAACWAHSYGQLLGLMWSDCARVTNPVTNGSGPMRGTVDTARTCSIAGTTAISILCKLKARAPEGNRRPAKYRSHFEAIRFDRVVFDFPSSAKPLNRFGPAQIPAAKPPNRLSPLTIRPAILMRFELHNKNRCDATTQRSARARAHTLETHSSGLAGLPV